MQRNKEADLLKLAREFFNHLQIINCEYGGIGLDCKRPFGNSDVEGDILEIIGWRPEGDDGIGPCYSSTQKNYAYKLYHEDLILYLKNIEKHIYNNLLNGVK